MRNDHTDITIILDRSGSMAMVAEDTIGGYNRFLADQQRAPGSARITLHQFDDEFETRIHNEDIATALPLTDKTFIPRGNTALLDAIGRGIDTTGARLHRMPEYDRPGKVIFVIITDGHENASRFMRRERLFEMIRLQREKYAWEFVFLGANQDAIGVAARLNIPHTHAMTYAANQVGTQEAYSALASNVASYRAGVSRSMAFNQKDRDAQSKAGADTY